MWYALIDGSNEYMISDQKRWVRVSDPFQIKFGIFVVLGIFGEA